MRIHIDSQLCVYMNAYAHIYIYIYIYIRIHTCTNLQYTARFRCEVTSAGKTFGASDEVSFKVNNVPRSSLGASACRACLFVEGSTSAECVKTGLAIVDVS